MIPGPAPVMTIQPRVGQLGGEVACLVVERVVGPGAGRAEDRDLGGRRGTGRNVANAVRISRSADAVIFRSRRSASSPARPTAVREDVDEQVAVALGAGEVEELVDLGPGHGGIGHGSELGTPSRGRRRPTLGGSLPHRADAAAPSPRATPRRYVVDRHRRRPGRSDLRRCTRENVRSIEGKLDEEWWA